jgi:hypothetical protein
MGFDQESGTRIYRFNRIEKGEPISRLVIAASLDLFLKNGVALQEGPVLCARKLTADLEQLFTGRHTLTDEDLVAFTAARQALQAQKAEARMRQPKRRPTPPKSPDFGGNFMPSTPYRA